MTANTNDNERETLSALFDGELSGDAARFALKRLGHDEQWRAAFGRWQLCGDVLRGHATAVASGDFAQRVAAAIAREAVQAQVQPTAGRAAGLGLRRGWIGGALAASVAVVALFVARPLSNGSSPAVPDAQAPVQVADAPAARVDAGAPASVPKAPAAPTAPAADLGSAAVAVAEVPRRAIERRNARSQNQRAALRSGGRRESPATAVATVAQAPATPATTAIASDGMASTSANPFRPQHSDAMARPWPRAVLPQYSSAGGINASYGNQASPSFYPFEPNMPESAGSADRDRASNPPPR